ncbi:MAG: hypothetical protein AB1564_15780 [Chloroflexota bacterium]
MSAEEIVEAWLGRTKYVFDINTNKIVDQQTDLSGLYFLGKQIVHRTVSGTLVFKTLLNPDIDRRELIAWWVENPYAINPIELDVFPVTGRYVTIERNKTGIKMAWQK